MTLIFQFLRRNIDLPSTLDKCTDRLKSHQDNQWFQLILWRNDKSQPLTTYNLDTVTYGLTALPYLTIPMLKQLAIDEGMS